MLRLTLACSLPLVFPSQALAQAQPAASSQAAPLELKPERLPSQVRDAGIYHLASGTWTRRPGAAANFGPDVIYSNTASSGYFTSAGAMGGFAAGGRVYDEGNVPGTGNPNNPGNRDAYAVNCVEIGYCDFNANGTGAWEISFYNGHGPCEGPTIADSTFQVTGLPTALSCWTVAIDLSGGNELCLAADGGDGFDGVLEDDTFAWSFRYIGPGTQSAGFLLTGDPLATDPNWTPGGDPVDGTNTYFGPASLCGPGIATGLLTQDLYFIEDLATPANDGCRFFGGYSNMNGCGGPSNPFASYWLELQADTGTCDTFSSFCLSNPNSTGVNSTMTFTGSTSVALDNATLTAIVPQNTFGFFLTSRAPGFFANPAGSAGNICVGSSTGRFQELAASSGTSGVISISTTAGQWSLTAIPDAQGPYSAMAGNPCHFQLWHRDQSPAGPTSNFTDGIIVTWTP